MAKKRWMADIPFWISGGIFSIFLMFTPLVNDDLNYYHDFAKSATGAELWVFVAERYMTWSSRILIEFVLMILEKLPKPVWAVAMGASWTLLLKCISEFFMRGLGMTYRIILACLSLLIPFSIFESAGWIATTHTYLTPAALGFFALLPLVREDEFHWYDYLLYSLAAVYASNLEQMAVVLVFIYGVFLIKELATKKVVIFHAVIFLVAAIGIIAALVCPGNKARNFSNVIYWYPNYGMLSLFDKLDMGISSTAEWLVRAENLFWYAVAFLLLFSICRVFRQVGMRLLGALPLVITLLIGFPGEKLGEYIPVFSAITESVPRNGLISVTNAGTADAFFQWMLMALLYISLILCVGAFAYEMQNFVVIPVLVGGLGSRFMMGFSPTIYASGHRTGIVMAFCLVAVGGFLLSVNEHKDKND